MEFEYTLVRKARLKNLCITVFLDNKIIVKASKTLPVSKINDFIRDKDKWIKDKLDYNKRFIKPYIPKKFDEGEQFLYLGLSYSLVLNGSKRKEILLRDNLLIFSIPLQYRNRVDYIAAQLVKWYKVLAYKKFLERISFYEQILKLNISDLRIKNLKRTWGSCTKKGVLTFSWRLIMAPVHIIDYIVVHELCHLIHHNHSAKFWGKVGSIIPNYKQCKKWLIVNENKMRF